jgi:hypothetical protein
MNLLARRRFLAAAASAGAVSAFGLAAFPTTGFAQPYPPPGAVIIAPREPPAPRYEVIPAPPRHRREVAVWSPGHWRWAGRGWVWVNGRYIDRPRREAIWVPGHWAARGPQWVWIPPHWQ